MAASYITSISAVGSTIPYSLNTKSTNTTSGLTVIIPPGTSGNFKVQYCPIPVIWAGNILYPHNADPETPPYSAIFPTGNYTNDMTTLGAWIDHPVLLNLTQTTASNIIIPTPTIRLVCNSWTSGTAYLVVNEGSYPG